MPSINLSLDFINQQDNPFRVTFNFEGTDYTVSAYPNPSLLYNGMWYRLRYDSLNTSIDNKLSFGIDSDNNLIIEPTGENNNA